MPFMNATTSSGCFSAITSVQVMAAGMLATCRRQSGYRDRSSIALNLPVASESCCRGPVCMYIASMTPFSSAVSSGRKARSCLWSRRSHSSDGFSISGPIISGLSYQSSG